MVRVPDFIENAAMGFYNNPVRSSLALATPVGLGVLGTGIGIQTMRERRQNNPTRIGQMSGAGFDDLGQPTERLQNAMKDWDDQQWQQYQTAASAELQNQVRLGQISPQQAESQLSQMNYNINSDSVSNSGQLQQAAMGGADMSMPDYSQNYGDTDSLGIGNEYWSQLRAAAMNQASIGEDVGDLSVSREFDRTMQYRRPIERDRNLEQYTIGEAQNRNAMRRSMAQNLMNSYANTQQALITSGL